MKGTPWSDGVPGVSQKPGKTGETFTSEWTATQSGSFWYHAHSRGQLDDGMYGPIIIHPAPSVQTPFGTISSDTKEVAAMEAAAANPYPLLMSDWHHRTSDDIWSITVASGVESTCVDSLLFNGMGHVSCLGESEIASLLSTAQKNALKKSNVSSFTAKG